MKKKIIQLIVWLTLVLLFVILIVWTDEKNYTYLSALFGVVIAYSFEKTIEAVENITDNGDWKESQRKLLRGKIINDTTLIRVSFAYLYRIKVDDKYMLIKNQRGTGKYQPIGGVYKYEPDEIVVLRNSFKVVDDNKIPLDASSKNDYRMQLPSKYLRKFLKRFNSEKSYRERIDNISREFKEELGDTLKWNKIKYRYCGRHISDLKFSNHYQCYELLLADVVELIPDENQLAELKELKRNTHSSLHFYTAEEIKSFGIKSGTRNQKEIIADHSLNILQESEQHLMKAKSSNCIFEVDLGE